MIAIPDLNAPYILETDASDKGIGEVLRQWPLIISYLSLVLRGAEINYSITEKEILASICAMDKCEYYLIGNEFTVITDHKDIESIRSKYNFGSQRIQRWNYRLERLNFKVCYIKGSDMIASDILSRNHVDNVKNDDFIHEKVLKIHIDTHIGKILRENVMKKKLTYQGKG